MESGRYINIYFSTTNGLCSFLLTTGNQLIVFTTHLSAVTSSLSNDSTIIKYTVINQTTADKPIIEDAQTLKMDEDSYLIKVDFKKNIGGYDIFFIIGNISNVEITYQ